MTRIVIRQSQDCIIFYLEFEQTDRQTDRQREDVYFTRLHG